MGTYQLYCFGELGNCYKAALMLELCKADWQPIFVDYFNGQTRTPEYRAQVNEMGEVPVLVHGTRKLSQSGVILDYLAGTDRQFGPDNDDERREILRWMLFDNHKFTSYLATLRFMISLAKTGETPVTEFLRQRFTNSIEDRRWPFGQATVSYRQPRHHRRLFAVRLHVLWRGNSAAA